jgi:hypothetical protein
MLPPIPKKGEFVPIVVALRRKDAAMRDVTMEPLRKEYASHMSKGKFVRDIAWKVSMQLISHQMEQSSSFLLSCVVDQLVMKLGLGLFMDGRSNAACI